MMAVVATGPEVQYVYAPLLNMVRADAVWTAQPAQLGALRSISASKL
jgi:hypothetical protein